MKYRLLATAAALGLAVSIHPALAQQNPNTGPSQRHEQDQGIKTGQTDKGSSAAAKEQTQGSQSSQGTGATEKNEEPQKKVTQPEKKDRTGDNAQDKTKGAADRDQDRSRKASDRERDRDKNARSTDRDRDNKSSDRNRNRNRGTAENKNSGKSVTLNTQQKTKISTAIRSARVESLKKVNFSVRVGAEVPAHVHFHALPSEIAAIVPQYRDYNYVVVQDRIVIVEPRTRKIVTIIDQPRQASHGGNTLSSHERRVIKNRTVSARQRPQIRERYSEDYVIGERVPDDVEFYDMPEVVYTEEPAIRRYRYIPHDRGVVVVEPRERRVIDVID